MSARNCAVFHRLMFNVALIFNIELGNFNAVSAEKAVGYNYMQQFAYLCELALKITHLF